MDRRLKEGMSLLEAVIGVAIITGVIVGLVNVFDNLLAAADDNLEVLQATYLLEEGAEAVRSWRDSGWVSLSALAVETNYYFALNAGGWATTTANTFIDGKFERRFRISNVNRDGATDDIVTTGGTLDPDTKLITVETAWRQGVATTTKSVSFYLTKLF